jgi:lipid A 3-O-deacylase
MKHSSVLVAALISISCAISLGTLNPSVSMADQGSTADDLYVKGGKDLQAGTGLLVSPVFIKTHRRELDYSMTFIRGGYFFTDPSEKSFFFRGNLEGLMQLAGSVVTKGFGSYMVEYDLLVRYNVVYPGWKIVPYIQIGAGVLYNDLYKNQTQALVGQSIEFTPQGSVGFRCLLDKKWSLEFEGIFHHISNAGLDDRNVGVNAFGGFIAVSYFFGK